MLVSELRRTSDRPSSSASTSRRGGFHQRLRAAPADVRVHPYVFWTGNVASRPSICMLDWVGPTLSMSPGGAWGAEGPHMGVRENGFCWNYYFGVGFSGLDFVGTFILGGSKFRICVAFKSVAAAGHWKKIKL